MQKIIYKRGYRAPDAFGLLIGCLSILIMSVVLPGCKESDDAPDDIEDDEELLAEMSPAELLYSNLTGALYTQVTTDASESIPDDSEEMPSHAYQPAKGLPLSEGQPGVRFEVAENYSEAEKDFRLILPDGPEMKRFVSDTPDGITIDLGKQGKVSLRHDSTDGAVALMEVDLDGYRSYKVYYRPKDTIDDNYASDDDFTLFIPKCSIVVFTCPVCKDNGFTNTQTRGLVLEVSDYACYVFTDHIHDYKASDHWKSFYFKYNLASVDNWRQMKDVWDENSEVIIYHMNHSGHNLYSEFCNIMRDWDKNDYVAVDGTDINAKKSLYWARWTWYSKTKLIKLANLRSNNFRVETCNYAYRKRVEWSPKHHAFSFMKLLRSKTSDIYVEYPVN